MLGINPTYILQRRIKRREQEAMQAAQPTGKNLLEVGETRITSNSEDNRPVFSSPVVSSPSTPEV